MTIRTNYGIPRRIIKYTADEVTIDRGDVYEHVTYEMFVGYVLSGDYEIRAANRDDKESIIYGLFI